MLTTRRIIDPAALLATALPLLAAAACHHVGPLPDADGGGDADGDADGDSDGDSDGDTDADTDPISCDEVPSYCCTEECPCADGGQRCVITYSGGVEDDRGVCKPEYDGEECWSWSDCGDGQLCIGYFACPCDMDCSWEGPGVCGPASGACCEDSTVACADGYTCLVMDGTDTCHGIIDYPQCWTDDDCWGGTCEGELLCPCDVDCMSVAGLCVAGG